MKKSLKILIIIVALLLAVLIAIFIKYPIYVWSRNDTEIEYKGSTYIKYDENKWEYYFDHNNSTLVGFGQNRFWGVYTIDSDTDNQFLLHQYRPIYACMVYIPTIYYNENMSFDEPSADNVKHIEIIDYSTGKHMKYTSDETETIEIFLDIVDSRAGGLNKIDEYIFQINLISNIDDNLYYDLALLETDGDYYIRDNIGTMKVTDTDLLKALINKITNNEINLK